MKTVWWTGLRQRWGLRLPLYMLDNQCLLRPVFVITLETYIHRVNSLMYVYHKAMVNIHAITTSLLYA